MNEDKKQIFKLHIDASMEPGSDRVENHVEVEMECSGSMAVTALVDTMRQDKDLRSLIFGAVSHYKLFEKDNDNEAGKPGGGDGFNLGIKDTRN